MSFASNLFGHHGMPSLFSTFGDDAVELVYRIGDNEQIVHGIRRAQSIEMRLDEHGDSVKVRVCQVVISTDSTHPWNGIADPQVTATWEIKEQGAPSGDRWSVDTEPGKGIQSISESLAVIHLVRMSASVRAHAGLYKS